MRGEPILGDRCGLEEAYGGVYAGDSVLEVECRGDWTVGKECARAIGGAVSELPERERR